MNAIAHDLVVDLSPDESGKDVPDLRVRDEAALWAAIPVAIVAMIAASVVEVGYQALILLWVLFGLPLIRLVRATAHVTSTGVEQVRGWFRAAGPWSGGAGEKGVVLTFDELVLIYKSLEAVKTLGALPPQDELLGDTIQVVDQALNRVVD